MIIYKHTSKTSGKPYIGFTKNTMHQRFLQHCRTARHLLKTNNEKLTHFHKAILKYGKDDFDSVILEQVAEDVWRERESYWIDNYDSYKNGYNMTLGGDGGGGFESGYVTVADENGITLRVLTSDPRYISGDLVHINKGSVVVKDTNGDTMRVSLNDPRYISGDLVHVNSGNGIPVLDIRTGKYVKIQHKDVLKNKHYLQSNAKDFWIIDNDIFRVSDITSSYKISKYIAKSKYHHWSSYMVTKEEYIKAFFRLNP